MTLNRRDLLKAGLALAPAALLTSCNADARAENAGEPQQAANPRHTKP